MATSATITAWITLIFGLYALGASIGELRRPGFWAQMVGEVSRSSALQFLAGIITLVLGATVYLVNPFNPADWLSILITVLGAFMMLEGIILLAAGDWFMTLSGKLMASAQRIWAIISLLFGIVAAAIAIIRLTG